MDGQPLYSILRTGSIFPTHFPCLFPTAIVFMGLLFMLARNGKEMSNGHFNHIFVTPLRALYILWKPNAIGAWIPEFVCILNGLHNKLEASKIKTEYLIVRC